VTVREMEIHGGLFITKPKKRKMLSRSGVSHLQRDNEHVFKRDLYEVLSVQRTHSNRFVIYE
jgi:hypothetical protein